MKRLESLDALRGFVMFCLVVLETTLHPLAYALNSKAFNKFMWLFTHVEWEGLSTWDLVMPLFMFMAGVSIPFSLSKYVSSDSKSTVYLRIFRRFFLLWFLGIVCQGNLLAFDMNHIYLYSNTLQAIAIGYLFSALIFLNFKPKLQILTCVLLLLTYWISMECIKVGEYGGGDYSQEYNLAELIDRIVLNRFRDGASVENGVVVFAGWYNYTWILSSLNFVVTVMTGCFAGQILSRNQMGSNKKALILLILGLALILSGWIFSFWQPIIKRIWTSSMTLVSSGFCFLVISCFYYWIDIKGHNKHLGMLKVFGMNSIAAYVMLSVIFYYNIGNLIFNNLQTFFGSYYGLFTAVFNVAIIYTVLWILYKKKAFIKV